MQAIIITIGDEILNGTTVDTNSAFISLELNKIGVDVKERISIGDTKEHIISTLNFYTGKFPLILITGGLGPTRDDITKYAIAEFFHTELVFNADVYAEIEKRFRKLGLIMTEKNRLQAMVPESCSAIENTMGMAPGMWLEKENSVIISMPGVPYEMKEMLVRNIIPLIKKKFSLPVIIHKHIMTSGIGESRIADKIEDIENTLPSYINLAYLPSPGIVKLRLTTKQFLTDKKKSEAELKTEINTFANAIISELGKFVFGADGENLESAIGKRLIQLHATVSTAESCTGGNIAHKITSVAGCSQYFKGAIICYADEIKILQLNVNPDTIKNYGAVSQECVSEMLDGALHNLKTDFAIAVSGIAGPDGGSEEKPVGTTYIGVASSNMRHIKKFQFAGNREINIEYASLFGLHELRMLLDTHLEKHRQTA